MAIRSKSKLVAAKIEAVFNTGEVLADADALEVAMSTSISATLDTIDRDVIRDSLIGLAPIPVRENVSGNVDFELIPSGTDNDLNGDAFWEAAMGLKSVAATAGAGTGGFIGFSDDGTTSANMIYLADAGDTADSTATVYTLSGTTDATKSLTIKEFMGADKSLLTTGNVIESLSIDLPTAGVCTAKFNFGGCGFETNNADTKLNGSCVNEVPFVGKSATFTVNDVDYDATDVSVSINNDVYNVETLATDGYSEKVITGKTVTGSFKILFEDFSELTAFQNSTAGALYIQIAQGTDKFAIYIPAMLRTGVSTQDDSGIVSQTIEFQVVEECGGAATEAIIVACENNA